MLRVPFFRSLAVAFAFTPLLLLLSQSRLQPEYSLLLKGAHLIDPANGIDRVLDIAVSGDRIASVEPHIASARAFQVIDGTGFYAVPGLIDLHAHVFGYEGAIDPDGTALPAGTTTVVDAGGSGWRTFDRFRASVIAKSKTRVLASLNIVGAGMVGEPAESNTADMDPAKTAAMINQNRDVIVGIKTAHFGGPGWTAIDRAVEAGRLAHVPVMVDDKIFTNTGRTTREKLLVHLRPGDMHTHMFNDRQVELIDRFTGRLQPYIREARARGVLFDMGHGAGSFLWPVASQALAQGFPPDTISTDLHSSSILMQQSDMLNCMSKMMLLGLSLPDVVARSTVNPAKAIGLYPKLGTLRVGAGADLAVLDLKKGVFAFKDSWGAKRMGVSALECVYTIRGGKLVYQRTGNPLSGPDPRGQIYDILLKNAHVLDPAHHRDGKMDVAINGSRISLIAPGLRSAQARQVIEAGDYYLTPGFIQTSPRFTADYQTLRYGITAAVGDSKADPHAKTRLIEFAGELPKPEPPGSDIQQIVAAGTVRAAQALHRPDLGALAEGGAADLALFDVRGGRAVCVLTIRDGAVVWDSEGLAAIDWKKAGPYTNFK